MLAEIKNGYIGNPNQLFTLRKVIVEEGRAKNTSIIEVATAGGLRLEVLPDAGLDIGQAWYRGTNVSWTSKNGYDNPASILPYETEFVNTFPGGLLYTCGLRSTGPANRDNGEWHPLHGRYHSLQAEQVSAFVEDENIIIRGVIRETALFGHNLQVDRHITIPIYGASITVEDKVTNLSPKDEEIMQVYHCNFGYPLVSPDAKLFFPQERDTIPRTEFAKTGLGSELTFCEPIDGEEERVFFQKMKNDFCAELINSKINICMKMTWSGDTLPILSQWRSMASGDYVLGLEPSNSFIMGRHEERKNGTLKVLKAHETINNKVKIQFSEED